MDVCLCVHAFLGAWMHMSECAKKTIHTDLLKNNKENDI